MNNKKNVRQKTKTMEILWRISRKKTVLISKRASVFIRLLMVSWQSILSTKG